MARSPNRRSAEPAPAVAQLRTASAEYTEETGLQTGRKLCLVKAKTALMQLAEPKDGGFLNEMGPTSPK